jgi:hypothetical protein
VRDTLALADPSAAVELEGLNYFADTLLFGGVILSLARLKTGSDPAEAGSPQRAGGARIIK